MSPGFSVRRASRDDAAVLAELNAVVQGLHHRAHPERFLPAEGHGVASVFREWLGADGHRDWLPGASRTRGWLCEDHEGRALGYVIAVSREVPASPFTAAQRWVELDQIAVRDDVRHAGVGRALAAEVVAWAEALGVGEVALSVWHFNEGAQAFFTSLGFSPLHHRMHLPLEPG